MTKDSALKSLKRNVKVLHNMKKLHADLENFHRRKVITKETLDAKIKKQLDTYREPESIVVPSGLQTNNSFHVPKPLQCSLHITSLTHDLYVGHYGAGPKNGLHVWNKSLVDGHIKRHKKALNCRISHMTFITNAYVYVAACTDLSLRVFSNKLREQCVVQLTYSILSMMYVEDHSTIIMGAVGRIEQWKLTNGVHHTPQLHREIILIDNFSGITPWISFLHYNKEQNLIIALAGTALFFIDATRFEQTAFIENRHSYPLTVCYSYVPSKYLVTGAKNGDIKVWNMSMNSFPYVGCFTGHLKKIVRIVAHPNEPLLITASVDSTIRFWRIETFQETYRFDVLDTIQDLRMVGPRKLYYTSQSYICLLDFNYFHSIFTLVGAKCLSISRYAPLSNHPARIMVVGDDGGVRIVSPTHGNILTMLFPVVTHRPVAYTHDPLEHRIYVQLQNGDVMVVSSKSNPCRTVELWKTRCDDEKVVCLCVLFLDVGADKKSILLGAHIDGCISLLKARDLEMKKVTPARGIITQFQVNTVQKSLADFLTYNTENTITLWKIRVTPNRVIHLSMVDDIQIEGVPTHIAFRGDCLALSHDNRLVTYHLDFKKRSFCTVQLYKHTKDEQHSKYITQLTSCSNLPIFATSSLDGHIKIWDMKCHLLRELVFDSTLSGVCFANGCGDILVGFQSNLHYVPVLEYLPYAYLQTLHETNVPDDKTEYCISFDPLLKFWYDPDRVQRVWMSESNQKCDRDDSQVQRITELCPTEGNAMQSHQTNMQELENLQDITELANRLPKKTMDKETLKNSRRNSLIPTSSLIWLGSESKSRRGSEDNSGHSPRKQSNEDFPLSTALADEIKTILSVGSLSPKNTEENADTALSIEEDGKKFWPCAPDGFIPNSTIRQLIKPKPELERVPSWKPKSLDCLQKRNERFEFKRPTTESHDNVRGWLSDDEEEENEENQNMDSLSYFLQQQQQQRGSSSRSSSKAKRAKKISTSSSPTNKKTFKKTAKTIALISKPLSKRRPSKSRGKKKRGGGGQGSISEEMDAEYEQSEEEEDGEEGEVEAELDKNEEEENASEDIPPIHVPIIKIMSLTTFLNRYKTKKWFPKDVGYSNHNKMVRRCLDEMDPTKPYEMREITDFIAELNNLEPLSPNCLDTVIQQLLTHLDDKSGQVRHYAVQALLKLGEDRKDVIVRLVQGLDDPLVTVREEVKMALAAMCGIKCADTLVAVLQDIGEYEEVPVSNDTQVVEMFRNNIISKKHSVARRATLAAKHKEMQQNIFNWLYTHQKKTDDAKKERKLSDKYQERERKKEKRNEKLKKKVIKDWASLVPNNKAKGVAKSWKKPTQKERMERIMQKTKYKEEKKPKKQTNKNITNAVPLESNKQSKPETPDLVVSEKPSKIHTYNTDIGSIPIKDGIYGVHRENGDHLLAESAKLPRVHLAAGSPEITSSSAADDDDDDSLYYKTESSSDDESDAESSSYEESEEESDSERPETCDFIVKSASPNSYMDTKITNNGYMTSSKTDVNKLLLSTEARGDEAANINPSDVFEIKMVNRSMLNEQGEGREDAIKRFAPRIYNKFVETDPEFAQKFEMTESQILQQIDGIPKDKSLPVLKDLHLKLAQLNNEYCVDSSTMMVKGHSAMGNRAVDNSIKKKGGRKQLLDPYAPAKKCDILNVQKAVLATAITALNSKRRNSEGLPQHGILGNQALNDINAMLIMFQKAKNTFNRKSLSTVYGIVEELQGEFGLVQPSDESGKAYGPQFSNSNENNKEDTEMMHVRLIPSPVQKDMVPGVHGERILSSFHVLPSIPKAPSDKCWRMKSIPERNGHSTVMHKRGNTHYGSMAFHWTTWTSRYDMNVNSQAVHNNNTEKINNNNDSDEFDAHHLPVILEQPSHRRSIKRFTPLTPPKLRSLMDLNRRSGANSVNGNRYVPVPPNTAQPSTGFL